MCDISVYWNICPQVTESGTKAAGVTSAGYVPVSFLSSPDRSAIFQADHPFLFVLRDKFHGVNFVMGRVTDPSAADN